MAVTFSPRDFVLGIIAGVAITALLIASLFVVFARRGNAYGLGHWTLNMRTPFNSMWMNLGYWTHPDGSPIQNFDEACPALFKQVLSMSGILETACDADRVSADGKALAVVDLGFGCGDQTWELARLIESKGWRNFCYVGLTLNEAQVQAASRKIHRELANSASRSSILKPEAFKLFCANAAKPETWRPPVKSALQSVSGDEFTEKWFLALDCLYHFSPSRQPVFEYAARGLGAHFMAFDLVFDEQSSRWNTLLVRAIGVMMGCPLNTFLTEQQYRHMLVNAGYDQQNIAIRDISKDVFPGVTAYLDRQERALSQYGISIGGFKLAGRIFKWFGQSGVVKASIVVARTRAKST